MLFATCQDARRACDAGIVMEVLNMGNLHYGPEKLQILPNVALSLQDREDLRVLRQRGCSSTFGLYLRRLCRAPMSTLSDPSAVATLLTVGTPYAFFLPWPGRPALPA